MSIATAPTADVVRNLRQIERLATAAPQMLDVSASSLALWVARAAALLEMPAPRAAVVINMTGGVLQGASATVPLDVYAIDYDTSPVDNDDQLDGFVMLDGKATELMQCGAVVDPALVAKVEAADSCADEAGAAGGGWFAVRYGPAGHVAGTIGDERFTDFGDADAAAARMMAAGDRRAGWATVQEMNADGTPCGGVPYTPATATISDGVA